MVIILLKTSLYAFQYLCPAINADKHHGEAKYSGFYY